MEKWISKRNLLWCKKIMSSTHTRVFQMFVENELGKNYAIFSTFPAWRPALFQGVWNRNTQTQHPFLEGLLDTLKLLRNKLVASSTESFNCYFLDFFLISQETILNWWPTGSNMKATHQNYMSTQPPAGSLLSRAALPHGVDKVLSHYCVSRTVLNKSPASYLEVLALMRRPHAV